MNEPILFKKDIDCLKEIITQVFQDKSLIIQFFLGLIVLGIGVASSTTLPFLLKRIVDSFSLPKTTSLFLILISYGFLWTFSQVSLHIRSLFTYKIEQRITFVLGLKALSHLFTLSQSYFLDQKPGAIANVIRKAQQDVPAIVLGVFFHALPTLLEFFCVIVLISSFYPLKYSFLLSGILGVFFAYTLLSMKSALKDRQVANEVDKTADGIVTDWLLNYEAVRIFGRQEYALSLCGKGLKKREESEVKFMTNLSLSRLGQTVILGIGLSLLTYLVGQDVLRGTLTVGDFVLFNGYILQFILPVSILGYVTQDIKKALLDMKGIIDILLTESTIKESQAPAILKGSAFSLEFNNVSFSYKNKNIIEDISFKIQPEKTVLIVGPTGIGKSTLIKLLLRTYDPTQGKILINHTNIKSFSLASLSDTMGFVPQETYLLNDTIQNNLRFVSPEASLKEMEEALDKAALLPFIKKLPEGIHTFVGDKGLKLSGGEKQRLALARLFLKKPKICIFDEPTSFLDRSIELTIQRNIETFLPNTTKIIITHRPFMFEMADQIITFEKEGLFCKPQADYFRKSFGTTVSLKPKLNQLDKLRRIEC